MAKDVGALKASRKASDEAYRQLVKFVNAYALIEGDSKYLSFIDYVNTEIVHYKREVIGQKSVTAQTSGTTGGTTGGGSAGGSTGGATSGGTPLVRFEGESAHFCPNDTACPPQIKGRIEHFISRKAMNIDSLGPETVDDYYQRGLIHDVADLYLLTVQDICGANTGRIKSAQKVVDGVQKTLSVPFERVVFAIGIRFVGETTAKLIARHFKTMEALRHATLEELMSVDGVGQVIAESVIKYFANPINASIVDRLATYGVQMQLSAEQLSDRSDKLAGKSIVISGVFALHSRDEYKSMIENNGGKNVGSISKKTSFILAGDNMGPSKLEKAQSLGIPLVSEQEFLDMIEDNIT